MSRRAGALTPLDQEVSSVRRAMRPPRRPASGSSISTAPVAKIRWPAAREPRFGESRGVASQAPAETGRHRQHTKSLACQRPVALTRSREYRLARRQAMKVAPKSTSGVQSMADEDVVFEPLEICRAHTTDDAARRDTAVMHRRSIRTRPREDQLERLNSERRYAAKLLLSAAWRHTRPDSA